MTVNIFAVCFWHPEGTRFTPEARVFYRITQSSRLSHIGASDRKKDAMLVGMKLHVHYLRSLEDSERVREGLPDLPADLVRQFLSGAAGHCCGAAERGCATSRTSGGAPLALEICLDKTGVWVESCEMGSEWRSRSSRLHASDIATKHCIGWRRVERPRACVSKCLDQTKWPRSRRCTETRDEQEF